MCEGTVGQELAGGKVEVGIQGQPAMLDYYLFRMRRQNQGAKQ